MTLEEFTKRYQFDPLKDSLGAGGFGEVYKAQDSLRNREVAIKRSKVKQHKFSLMREMELANEVEPHPNIARYENCYRFVVPMTGEVDFAVLTYYPHGNLDDVLKNNQLSEEEIEQIIKGILEGVGHLHDEGFVHRDLKSGNILMEHKKGKWIPKIADFGLSRIAGGDESSMVDSAIAKTPAYAAPEQILQGTIRSNADIWAVGVIIYKIMTGKLPFYSDAPVQTQRIQDVTRQIVKAQIPPQLASIPQPYQSIIQRCLVKDKDLRAESTEELLQLLRSKKDTNSVEKEKPSVFHKPTENVADEKTVLDNSEHKHNVEIDNERTVLDSPENEQEDKNIEVEKKEVKPIKIELPPPLPEKKVSQKTIPKKEERATERPLASSPKSKKGLFIAAAAVIGLVFVVAIGSQFIGGNNSAMGSDGAALRGVKIGNQVWMTSNLSIDAGENFCRDNDCVTYGRYYTWEAAKNACPSGWRLPSKGDWEELANNLGGYVDYTNKQKEYGDAKKAFRKASSTGLNIKAFGYHRYKSKPKDGGYWSSRHNNGDYWSSSNLDSDHAYFMNFSNEYGELRLSKQNKKSGLNCRCIKN